VGTGAAEDIASILTVIARGAKALLAMTKAQVKSGRNQEEIHTIFMTICHTNSPVSCIMDSPKRTISPFLLQIKSQGGIPGS
jgi:hypothetical protein